MITDFGLYLSISTILAIIFMFVAYITSVRDGKSLNVLEVLIGIGIWTAIITFVFWIIHMVILGVQVS